MKRVPKPKIQFSLKRPPISKRLPDGVSADQYRLKMRLYDGRYFDRNILLDIYLFPHNFIDQRVVGNPFLTTELEIKQMLIDDIKEAVLKKYLELNEEGISPTVEWFRDIVNNLQGKNEDVSIKGRFPYFSDFFEWYIDNKAPTKIKTSSSKPVSKRTINKYKQALSKIQQFEEYKKRKLKPEEYDIHWYDNFIDFLKEVLKQENKNTIGSYIKDIKIHLKIAKEEYDYSLSKDFLNRKFKVIREETNPPYLTLENIAYIYNYEIPEKTNQSIINVRKLLLISCWTGMRGSDFCSYNWKNPNWEKGNEGRIFIYKAKKTQRKVSVPVFPMVSKILENPPHPISTQKFNIYVKDLLRYVKLDTPTLGSKVIIDEITKVKRKVNDTYPFYELCSSHIGRRSFATNFEYHPIPIKDGKEIKLSRSQIMALTGHRTEADFLTYIKKVQSQTAQDIASQIFD
ncbi:site-specific integrase [Parvicella tangerina]|uniref:Phage integrase SAM-like domain-containing protein n=1 Tax=Parvicella tangerina TaxID=2829795 RepID=A0A916JQQ0_9FLAO|nr:site-specific integrase [Parvicella tangerina]CAG5085040.1 hypothetical protein CRYO30217_02632 [Parvicella tangerina]